MSRGRMCQGRVTFLVYHQIESLSHRCLNPLPMDLDPIFGIHARQEPAIQARRLRILTWSVPQRWPLSLVVLPPHQSRPRLEGAPWCLILVPDSGDARETHSGCEGPPRRNQDRWRSTSAVWTRWKFPCRRRGRVKSDLIFPPRSEDFDLRLELLISLLLMPHGHFFHPLPRVGICSIRRENAASSLTY
jgi:hypothetical protein